MGENKVRMLFYTASFYWSFFKCTTLYIYYYYIFTT